MDVVDGPETRTAASQAAVTEQLRALGVRPGAVLVVHTVFRAVRPVEGGPNTIFQVGSAAGVAVAGTLFFALLAGQAGLGADVLQAAGQGAQRLVFVTAAERVLWLQVGAFLLSFALVPLLPYKPAAHESACWAAWAAWAARPRTRSHEEQTMSISRAFVRRQHVSANQA